MYKAFIEPDLRSAHLKVYNSFNPFAGFQDPTYILKSDEVVDEAMAREVLSSDGFKHEEETEVTDIYLLPPGDDPETCTSWLRMRNRDGHYTLMFEETVCDGDVMISPRINFEVGVRILGGLMALGYEVGAIMKRRSKSWSDELLTIKVDWIEGLDRSYTQIQGKVRAAVEEAGTKLGLDGTYVPHSFIEQVQLERMTDELREMTAEMKDKFVTARAQRDARDVQIVQQERIRTRTRRTRRRARARGRALRWARAPPSQRILSSRQGGRARRARGEEREPDAAAGHGAEASDAERKQGVQRVGGRRSAVAAAAVAAAEQERERAAAADAPGGGSRRRGVGGVWDGVGFARGVRRRRRVRVPPQRERRERGEPHRWARGDTTSRPPARAGSPFAHGFGGGGGGGRRRVRQPPRWRAASTSSRSGWTTSTARVARTRRKRTPR